MTLPLLVQGKYVLKRMLAAQIEDERKEAAERGAKMLFDLPDLAVVQTADSFTFRPDYVPPGEAFVGPPKLERHYWGKIGKLDTLPERRAALVLSASDRVRHWVRNVASDPVNGFWFSTSAGKFYPDFVAERTDGKVAVIEYKGGNLWADAAEDRNVGASWAERSGGRCFFAMVSEDSRNEPLKDQIDAVLA